jgi:curli biogenesis system outer membrane secretion channel CsgG
MFCTAFFKSGNFDLVERDRIEKVFKEQEFQLSGIVDPATVVEIGRILGSQAIVTGRVTYINFAFMNVVIGLLAYCTSKIDVRVISTETGKLIGAVSETGRSYTFGVPVKVTASGKTRDDLLGLKRTSEDMINSSLRNAVDKAVSAINKQLP